MTRRTFGSIRKLPSGKHQAQYYVDGVRFTGPRPFLTRGHASTYLARTETQISNGTWVNPRVVVKSVPGFEAYATKWVDTRKLTPRTRDEYRGLMRRLLLPEYAELKLDDITVRMVREWFGGLRPTPTENARGYSLLKTILSTAMEDEILEANPCRIKNGSRVSRARRITVLSAEQVQTLAGLVPRRYRMLVLITAFCCLRFGEVTALRRKDFTNGELSIAQGVTRVKGEFVVGDPKTEAGERTVPVMTWLRADLAAHILEFAEPGEDGLIFPRDIGGHLPSWVMTSVLDPARAALGRTDFSFHHLRHTGAVIWAQDPHINLKDLMSLLGHTTPEMALLYQHVVDGKLTEISDRLSDKIFGPMAVG